MNQITQNSHNSEHLDSHISYTTKILIKQRVALKVLLKPIVYGLQHPTVAYMKDE